MGWLVRLAYDGTDLHGAAAVSGLPTVLGDLREALARLGATEVGLDVLSRTDAGVHAEGNVVVVSGGPSRDPAVWLRGLAHQLPDRVRPVAVAACDPVPTVVDKTYRYTLDPSVLGDPFTARRAWRVQVPWEGLVQAAAAVPGPVDWAPFRRRDEVRTDLRRRITQCAWAADEGLWHVTITGDGFVMRGVRSLVGAMVHVARGHASPEDLRAALDGTPHPVARQQAPAHGLSLVSIRFAEPVDWVGLTPRSASS